MRLIPTIIAGGDGTRLWPRSRTALPKQFLDIVSHQSMLADTAARFTGDTRFDKPVVAGGAQHGFLLLQQLAEANIDPLAVICEPLKRNTAPAIAAAAKVVADLAGPDAILCVMPADQAVTEPAKLCDALALGGQAAADGRIVTIGISPTGPATGYGYIEMGPERDRAPGVRDVARFVEKPDRETAEEFLRTGRFVWNAGMFVARADVLLAEIGQLAPDVLAAVEAAVATGEKGSVIALNEQAFARSPSISFDYAVMEKTRLASVVPVSDIGWSDVGSWSSLWELNAKDEAGNALKGDVVAIACRDNHIESMSGLVVGMGLERMMVVQTRDATLVAPLDQAQEVSALVQSLKAAGRAEVSAHTKVHRPWGWYDSLWQGQGYQVKHLMVAPGAAISLQLHNHRSEHWVILRGRAMVTRDKDVFELAAGQSAFIPLGARHRLENKTDEELHVIEVQLGDYLGEDDIVRFEDRYNRV